MLPEIKIASPCPASWEQMVGDDRVRHCAECNLNVYNLSEMTSAEIEALIAARAGERFCGRLYQRPDGTILTRDCPVGLRAKIRRVSRRLTGALAAAISLVVATGCSKPLMGVIPHGHDGAGKNRLQSYRPRSFWNSDSTRTSFCA